MNTSFKKLINVLLSVLCLFSFLACSKEEVYKGDENLQIFWEFTGFHSQDGQTIYEPNFNKEELFHYFVNLLFLWNDYTQEYEIQGQGPYDIFWGSYTSTGNSLSLTSLETTDITSDLQSLNDYDVLFFVALCSVSSYSIENGRLKLYFDGQDKYMLFQRQKNPALFEDQNLKATIDNMNWEANSSTLASVTSGPNGSPYTTLGGTSKNALSDGAFYEIGITINGVPHKG